ncbi:MAG: RNA polymerase sigma factor [Planctomycetales bacterium]|nr:RNA polymerase sigma factor [Planctomycetales bacterium]
MSLDELVREHLPAAMRFAWRLTGDQHVAEDIVQEALLRVSRSWRGFRRQAAFRTWLFRIVINVFRDHLASRASWVELPSDLVDGKCGEPGRQLVDGELEAFLAQQIRQLPSRQREVLVLHVYEQLSPADIAKIVGIRVGNVHSTMNIARKTLATRLASSNHAPNANGFLRQREV